VVSLGISAAVTFTGYQAGEDFVRWLQVMDEVWILGLGNDWAGRAAVEARACGVRVLAVDEGALPSWADVVVKPEPLDILAASRGGARRGVVLASAAEVAREVCALYGAL
jgi:fructose-1,6-bisphosphatase/sedoheptulose 1,7-bisphosphatase-like protein